MERFVWQQNVAHFRKLLAAETSEARRSLLRSMLADAERKLAESEDDEQDERRDRKSPDA